MTPTESIGTRLRSSPYRLAVAVIGLTSNLVLCTGCVAQTAELGLLRESTGTIEYRTTNSSALRGTEQWTMMVHKDGSRTLNTRIHNLERGSRTNIIQRVAADFRPLDVIIQGWTGDDYRGIGLFTATDTIVKGLSRGPRGDGTHEVAISADVTLLSHAVAADAWVGLPARLEEQGQGKIKAYSVDLKPTASPSFLGKIIEAPVEWMGREIIRVPAGQFDTTHLRLAGTFNMWILGPDRIMVRMLDEKSGREYLLVEYDGPR